jgi:peptidoglycan hydrolase-like amidase
MPAGWIAAGSALLGVVGSSMQADAASSAAGAQSAAAQAGIAEQQRQFDAVQKLLRAVCHRRHGRAHRASRAT